MTRTSKQAAGTSGFTLVELLVVITIIAVLTSLIAPSLHSAKQKGLGVVCVNNHRQLQIAWHLYAEDNSGRLPQGGDFGTVPGAENWFEYGADVYNTNAAALLTGYGSIGPYAKAAAIYKCPSDRSFRLYKGQRFPHVRSISLNIYMNVSSLQPPPSAVALKFETVDAVAKVGASRLFVFIDEHSDTIQSGGDVFWVHYREKSDSVPGLIQLPSARHVKASPLSFADGHVEMRRWRDSRLLKPITGSAEVIWCPNSPDFDWLEYHASARISTLAGSP